MAKTKAEIQREYEKRTGYEAQKKYKKEKQKRIPLDVGLDDYDKIKDHAIKTDGAVNTFIKRAIWETMDRDNGMVRDGEN